MSRVDRSRAQGAAVESKPSRAATGEAGVGKVAPAIEAVLLCADKPLAAARLCDALGTHVGVADGSDVDAALVRAAVDHLNADYERTGRSFRIEAVAGGYQIMTLGEFAPVIAAFRGARSRSTLSRAAVETLAVVAYKQPITRAGLEAIRGVACGEILRSLIDRRLITIAGRADEPGRPILYGTTRTFLETFGLASLKDLPSPEEFRARGEGVE